MAQSISTPTVGVDGKSESGGEMSISRYGSWKFKGHLVGDQYSDENEKEI